ncbi:hypothetical protein AB8P56_21495, partial [Yersinia enterocolitica]|uniref:hypothetical protein n=4 Tax=Yersiniaceae TaxID=1903411 RepID=UPI0037D8CCF8
MTALDINSPLLHLAMLETLKRDDIRDEIDLFLPFIAVTVSEIGKATITDIDVQERLLQSFGFKPPLSAIQVLMSRAKKRGMLKRENYAFIPIHEKVVEWKNGYEDKKLDLEVSLSSLKNEFINFTKDKFGKNISSEDSESLILSFIEENVSSVITERAYDKSLLNKEIKNTDHIIASFIGHIHRNMPTTLEHFSRCVKGMLLANYLFYADKAISKNSYSDIVVYLDSPIIVGLLGYNGVQKKQVLDEFLGLLKTLEIKTKIFDKSLSEIEGLLYA